MSVRRPIPLQAVAFDLGGVLVSVDASPLERLTESSSGGLDAALFESGLHASVACGKIDGDAFIDQASQRAGLPAADLAEAWRSMVQMRAYAEQALSAPRIPVLIWSNTDPLHFDTLAQQCPTLRSQDIHLGLSYELGCEKPDPLFFTRALESAGLAPPQVVFFDDRADNVAAALELGIDAVQVTSHAEIQSHLEARGLA
jgi:putative hydrolase of the HAD superfamily